MSPSKFKKYNIIGCLNYHDLKGAKQWLSVAKSEYNEQDYILLIREILNEFLVANKFDIAKEFISITPDSLHNTLNIQLQRKIEVFSYDQVKSELNEALLKFDFVSAYQIYKRHKGHLPDEEYLRLFQEARVKESEMLELEKQKRTEDSLSTLEKENESGNYAEVRGIIDQNIDVLPKEEVHALIEKSIIKSLSKYNFTEAERIYSFFIGIFPQVEFTNKYNQYENHYTDWKLEQQRISLAYQLMEVGDYESADNIYLTLQSEPGRRNFFQKKQSIILNELKKLEMVAGKRFADQEKTKALSSCAKHLLLQARAGSGKTSTIALKVHQLITHYNVKPEEYLVLAFNTKAAKTFRKRINAYCGATKESSIANESNTLTFHALAKRIGETNKNILTDSPLDNETFDHNKITLTDFIRKQFEALENEDNSLIQENFYEFLRSSSQFFKKDFKNDQDFYLYLRNLRHTTISGDRVKSHAEKYIADFLFEHNIYLNNTPLIYKYEWNIKSDLGTSYSYTPDFALYEQSANLDKLIMVIEYFGFTPSHTGFPGFFETKKESQQYIQQSEKKRYTFQNSHIPLIELNADDFTGVDLGSVSGREYFEMKLKERLESSGLTVSPLLSLEERLLKIPNSIGRKNRLIQQIKQFIARARRLYSAEEIKVLIDSTNNSVELSERAVIFLKIACPVYQKYEEIINDPSAHHIDFDGLLELASNKLLSGSTLFTSKGVVIDLKKVKYILIDEYQDFSELFYKLIGSIIKINPEIRFFCVGDDWQAINGFAGSDLKFLSNFQDYFSGGEREYLQTNYRSDSLIVEHSNDVMSIHDQHGVRGLAKAGAQKGQVHLLKKLHWVNMKSDSNIYTDNDQDRRYKDEAKALLGNRNNDVLTLARQLKTVVSIIDSLHPDDKLNKIYLLFRRNTMTGDVKITKFAESITKLIENSLLFQVESLTAHSSKGEEAEYVIIVDAVKASFPLLHPDNELMKILGVTMEDVIAEERRLFYVACSRAEKELFILSKDEGDLSDFVPKENWEQHMLDEGIEGWKYNK